MTKEVMKQALKALQIYKTEKDGMVNKAIKALEEALKQEQGDLLANDPLPRACNLAGVDYQTFLKIKAYMPLYTTPQFRKIMTDSYIKEVIEALYENSDPVSVEAAELLERINAKQEQDEPVGKFAKFTDGIWREVTDGSAGVPLYTHSKEWIGLTEKQIDDIYYKSNLNIDDQYNQMYEFVKAIELAHGIKD